MRRQMWVRVATLFATLLASALASMTGCLPDQERTTYGPPEALGPRKFPDPEPGGGTPPPPGDAGGDPGGLCGGQGPIDAGDCSVKWSDLFTTQFAASAPLRCGAGGCHAPGATSPEISADNASKAWEQLIAYSHKGGTGKGKKYINPCSKEPGESAIVCNMDNSGTCGSNMPSGGSAPADVITKITDWVKCGAPNN